jgi:hypothetical protein
VHNRGIGINWLKITILSLAIFILVTSLSYAAVGESKKLTSSLEKKISLFLAQRGYGNITAVGGEEIAIQNGYFLRVDGIDKSTKKNYTIEIICSFDYSNWALLMVKEKTKEDSLSKKQ